MTALSDYQRLEAPGLWRPRPEAQRRDVTVALGDATLVIYDNAARPLAHWSLPAVERINPGLAPALFRPGPDSPEELEIADREMLAAIERVGRAIRRVRPHRGRLRVFIMLSVFAAIAALATLWLPDAIIRHAAAIVPEAKRQDVGERLQLEIHRLAGQPCQSPLGSAALNVMHQRLIDGPGRLVVLPGGIPKATHLPGGIILLNRALVEDYEDPSVVAGYVLAEDLRAEQIDPLETLLRQTGVVTAFRLLTTGDVPHDVLANIAQSIVTTQPVAVTSSDLSARFTSAGLPATPYAYAEDITGERTVGLIEADSLAPEAVVPVLQDSEWVSLQAICGE